MAGIVDNEGKSFERRVLEAEYQRRFTYLKNAYNASLENDHDTAFSLYAKYLKIVADVNECDIFALQPSHFNGPAKMSEMLVMSNVYLNMAKYYSLSSSFDKELQQALNQFILFTSNEPYQIFNSESLRKYLKKNKVKHGRSYFEKALRTIYIRSKRCFIATHLYGEDAEVTTTLRAFKNIIVHYYIGQRFIEAYYATSPHFVYHMEKFPRQLRLALELPLKLFISSISCIIKKVIKE